MTLMNRICLGLACLTLAACAAQNEDLTNRAPLGDFLLGHNIVVAEGAEIGPLSREATPEEWQAVLTKAVEDRLAGYDGDHYYHVAIKVEGYMLALPGVPLVANPKSALIITASIWDDEAGGKINEEPEQFTVFESVRPETIFSSGLTRTKEEQMEDLARNAARAVHNWMIANGEWFGQAPAEAGIPADAAPAELGALPEVSTEPLAPVEAPSDA